MGGAKRSRMVNVLLGLTLLAASVAGVQEAMGADVRRVVRSTQQLYQTGILETRERLGVKFRIELVVDPGRHRWHRLRVTDVARRPAKKVSFLEALPDSYKGRPAMVIHGNVRKDVALRVEKEYWGLHVMSVTLSKMMQIAALEEMEWFVVRAPTDKAVRLYKDLYFDDDPSGANQLLFPLKGKGPGYPSVRLKVSADPNDERRHSFSLVEPFRIHRKSGAANGPEQLPLPVVPRPSGTPPRGQRTPPFGPFGL